MTYYAICGLLGFLVGVPCAIFILFHKPRTSAKIMWSIYSLTLSLFDLGLYLSVTTNNHDLALLYCRINNFIDIFTTVFFINFVVLLTNSFKEYKKTLFIYYGVCIVYSIISIIGYQYYIVDVVSKMGFLYYPNVGPIFYFLPFFMFFIYSHGLLILYRAYQKASVIRKNQYKYLAIVSALTILGAGTSFFLVFNIPVFPFGQIVLSLHDWLIAFIIVKYHLLDIRVIIRKGLVYAILASVITVLYLASIYMVERLFHDMLGYQSRIGSLSIIVLIGVFFVPLKERVQSFVDKYFFKASYLQIIEQNDLLRQQAVRGERYQNMAILSQRIIDELRNPLTALVGYGYQLPKRLNDQEFLKKFQLVFDKEVQRIQVLIQELSDFSELKPLNLMPVDIVVVVNELLDHLATHLEEKQISFYRYYDSNGEIIVNADNEQIKRALYVFLAQSIRSTSAKGQIWVGIEDTMDGAEISIKDTGSGFTQEELAHIFDPLISISKSSNDPKVSLAQAQNIISHHGGKVMVDSHVNLGTEWILHIPKLS